jgi:hypothetical protein
MRSASPIDGVMSGQDAIERVAEVTGAAGAPQRTVAPNPPARAIESAAPALLGAAQDPQPPASPGASAQVASFAAALSEAEMAMLTASSMATLSAAGEGASVGAGATLPLLGSELQGLLATLPTTLAEGSSITPTTGAPTVPLAGTPTPYAAGDPTSAPLGDPAAGTLAPTSGVNGASAIGPLGLSGLPAGGQISERIVRIAESQAGNHEEPMGSNEGPAIAMYRSATRGAIPGAPWCAYFVSWVARQAGEPIGSEGQGLGAVSEIWEWAQQTGRAIPNAPGVLPKPGDLIVFGDQHVGIVRGVLPNGQIETVEGNYENKVALNVRSPSEPTGYVEMG